VVKFLSETEKHIKDKLWDMPITDWERFSKSVKEQAEGIKMFKNYLESFAIKFEQLKKSTSPETSGSAEGD